MSLGSGMPRCVLREALDDLAPEDPRARRSRRDLKRVHRAMGSLSILRSALSRIGLSRPPKRIVELGAGDGSLMLRLARTVQLAWRGVELTLLDRHRAVDVETLDGYRKLGWQVQVQCEDAVAWARSGTAERYDLCVTTLFLHHFADPDLRILLAGVAAKCHAFIASEPRRDLLAHVGSRFLGLLGTSAITRDDAVKSVAAGFSGHEITAAWPAQQDMWRVQEFHALPFSHCFVAIRRSSGAART